MPFRDAHEIVGALVRRLVQENRSFESLTLDEWRAHSPLFDADVRDFISPLASVARKRTPQSTHPEAVAAALGELREWLGSSSASDAMLFSVHHADAVDANVDRQRPLSDAGHLRPRRGVAGRARPAARARR